ncbi:DUF2090 domain-containing protein [Candidatus Uhrbacteria bacterium]|nr:DUF2090 domain-containing protein [Candidatus Uhrbacteria bacterium]
MNRIFILPFDHRSGFDHELLGFPYPPENTAQKKRVQHMKRVVYEGFLRVYKASPHKESLFLLVDEEFGTPILKDAKRRCIPFALTIEKSGQEEFDFAHGQTFGKHLLSWKPAYAKALVRYNVRDDNGRQLARLKRLSTFCRTHHIPFLFELLLTGTGSRISQMQRALREITRAGVQVDLWKVEGLGTPQEWRRVHALTGTADIVVLGRAGSTAEVRQWLKTAAKSGVVNGFAVGRTIFFPPLKRYRDKKISRAEAVTKIARAFQQYIDSFSAWL